MEKSALVYIILTAVTVAFGFLVKNRDYTTDYLSGRRCLSWEYLRGSDGGRAGQTAGMQCCGGIRHLLSPGRGFCLAALLWAVITGLLAEISADRSGKACLLRSRFVYLVKFFHLIFGEGSYLPIFGFFSLITVFFFLKALHDQADWYVFSLFLLLTQGFYFNSMNSVRYYFALALVMYAQKYVLRENMGSFFSGCCWAVRSTNRYCWSSRHIL